MVPKPLLSCLAYSSSPSSLLKLSRLSRMGSPFSYLRVISPKIQKRNSTTLMARKVCSSFLATASLKEEVSLFWKQVAMAMTSLTNIRSRSAVQQPTTTFLVPTVMPFQAATALAAPVSRLTTRLSAPRVSILPSNCALQAKPKKRKIQARLPGLLEQRCTQQKAEKRMRRVSTTTKMTRATANLKKTLLLAQTLLCPKPAKETTSTMPAKSRSAERKMQKAILLNSCLQRMQRTARRLAASMMKVTTRRSLVKEESQMALSSSETQRATSTERASWMKRRQMLKALLLDSLMSTYIQLYNSPHTPQRPNHIKARPPQNLIQLHGQIAHQEQASHLQAALRQVQGDHQAQVRLPARLPLACEGEEASDQGGDQGGAGGDRARLLAERGGGSVQGEAAPDLRDQGGARAVQEDEQPVPAVQAEGGAAVPQDPPGHPLLQLPRLRVQPAGRAAQGDQVQHLPVRVRGGGGLRGRAGEGVGRGRDHPALQPPHPPLLLRHAQGQQRLGQVPRLLQHLRHDGGRPASGQDDLDGPEQLPLRGLSGGGHHRDRLPDEFWQAGRHPLPWHAPDGLPAGQPRGQRSAEAAGGGLQPEADLHDWAERDHWAGQPGGVERDPPQDEPVGRVSLLRVPGRDLLQAGEAVAGGEGHLLIYCGIKGMTSLDRLIFIS